MTNNSTVTKQLGSSVRVIGDRGSGKTGYMAALVRWPNASETSAVKSINPFNDEGKELITKAQNILEQGDSLSPTPLDTDVDQVKDYGITIVLKEQFNWELNKLIQLNINCKDYAGEFFSDLLYRRGDILLEKYIEDCVLADGLLLMLDGLGYRKDANYAQGLGNLLQELDHYGQINQMRRRIALVVTKCEQPQLWVNRHNPKLILEARFPQTLTRLQQWQNKGEKEIDFFCTSAFGMLGKDFPEPNMKIEARDHGGIKQSCLKNARLWKP
ncbi:MAG TPA: hypothetical protein V6C58_28185, partial [Allocoleopsis sp.]